MPPGLQILLAGRDRDRIISRLLPRRIAKHDLARYVRRIGTIAEQDMPDLYAAADAVVLPSIYEGLPNAIIEASNCGIPAIVSTGANADKLVVDGETGFEVPNGNVRALADAIERMARLSPADREHMGAAATRAIRRLDPDRILRETLDLYEACIARKLPELSEPMQCAG
jgi:glycogen(starch) synthase